MYIIKKNNNEVTFFVDGEGSSSTWGHSTKGYLPINPASISDNLKHWIEEQIWKLYFLKHKVLLIK